MKITPEEIQAVLDYIDQTSIGGLAKVAVLDHLMKTHSELTEEEKEAFPDEVAADLRLADFSETIAQLADDEQIENLKDFVSNYLDLSEYRGAPPYYRAKYAYLNALGCRLILDNTNKYESERDLWIYRGLKAIDIALDLFSRMEDSENFCTAVLAKTEILTNKSLKEAADFALLGIRMAPNEELKQRLVEYWKNITDKQFDLYFEPQEASFINQLPLPKETIEKMCQEDSSLGRFMENCLCSIEPNYDRSPILFVRKIEDIAEPEIGELAEDAKYVFCLDRIPPELRFDQGHPQANILYVVDDEDTTLYHEYKEENED